MEIGWTWYGRRFWGGRTNPATKLLTLAHAFDTLGLNRVAFRCDTRIVWSAHSILRLGANPEGVLRAHRIAADGSIAGSAYFSILRAERPTVRSDLQLRLADASNH